MFSSCCLLASSQQLRFHFRCFLYLFTAEEIKGSVTFLEKSTHLDHRNLKTSGFTLLVLPYGSRYVQMVYVD